MIYFVSARNLQGHGQLGVTLLNVTHLNVTQLNVVEFGFGGFVVAASVH